MERRLTFYENKVDSKKKRVISYCLFPLANQVALTHNKSGRFESRFVSVGIQESPSVWLRGMEGSALGVWVAHGEGTMTPVWIEWVVEGAKVALESRGSCSTAPSWR